MPPVLPRAFTFRRAVSLWLAAALLSIAPVVAQVDGQLRWAFSTLSTTTAGDIVSSPAQAADGTIYLGVEVGSAGSLLKSGRLLAVRPDGTLKWSFSFPAGHAADWIDSTPAIGEDGTVYFGSWNGYVYAVKPEDGSVRWSYATDGFVASSAAIGHDGTVYIGSGDGDLYALTRDGGLRWIFPTGDWIDSSPAIGTDGTVYVGSWDYHLYAVSPDGRERWRAATGDAIVGSPCVGADGSITVGSRDRYLYSFRPDGTLRWRKELGAMIEGSPVLGPTGTVYVATTGGRLFALNPDGTEQWQYPRANQAALQALYSTPAVRRDGSIILGTANNSVIALRPDGTLLWSTAVGDWIDSSPMIGLDGTIYVGCTDKKLYAITGTQLPLLGDWPQHRRDSQRNAQQVNGRLPGTTGRLTNLSTRAVAGADSATLITGFVVGGSGSRTVLVRGIGPTLTQFGVTGVLADPRLTAFDQDRNVILTNDNWGDAPNVAQIITTLPAVGAFAVPPESLDAMLLRSFTAGAYTAHVTGAAGTTGVALLELYDAGGDTSRLINISARSQAGVGSNILIVGFVIGSGPRTVLLRGAGPALAPFFGAAALANPQLRLFRGQQLIAENDNWGASGLAAELPVVSKLVGAFELASGSQDAALMVTLPPGQYTAHVVGVNNTTGIALAEVYEVP
jgi:outer membrane protein assembly factor BamB